MKKALLVLSEGFEEIEATTTIDILRRACVSVTTVSLTGEYFITGARGVSIETDELFENLQDDFDMLILPGGPGTKNYFEHKALLDLITKYNENGKYLAAICAAPTVFGKLGLLKGKKAVCFPGCENELIGAVLSTNAVEVDGTVITSKAAGTAVDFALKLAEILLGEEVSKKVKSQIYYEPMLS